MLLCSAACLPSPPSGRFLGAIAAPSAEPSRAVILGLGLAADDARAQALARADSAALAGMFAGAALVELETAVTHLSRLHDRVERRLDSRRLVHWSGSPSAPQGVLELSGTSRLVDDARPGGWSQFLEQWEFTLAWTGRWRVAEAIDLAPGTWWT
jgi:hypothetical protein